MSLFPADVPIDDVITTPPEKARALENSVRARILDMLADEEMAIEEIHDELERRGANKAETTVRHHVNVLEDAEMVEVSRLEEVGGGTRKYYRSNTRVFSYELSDDAEETLDPASETVRTELRQVVERLFDEHGTDIQAVAEATEPCDYCSTQHYEAYIVRELVDRALTDLDEDGAFDDLRD